MRPEDGSPAPADDADAWLDGLAGRGGTSPHALDGARVRAALRPKDEAVAVVKPPAWDEIVSASRAGAVRSSGSTSREAANDERWRRAPVALAAALALVLGVGLWSSTPMYRGEGTVPRGTASASVPVWRTQSPEQDSTELSNRLRAAGARVTLTPIDSGFLLQIDCDPAAMAGVNEQLAPLEAAVDSGGKLSIRVLPIR